VNASVPELADTTGLGVVVPPPAPVGGAVVEDAGAPVVVVVVGVPPVTVNGPTVMGSAGRSRVTPESGTGVGMVTSKLNGPSAVVAGVAPAASICVEAMPWRSAWIA